LKFLSHFTGCSLRGAVLALGCLLAARAAWGQNVQFPTMVEPGTVAAPGTTPGWTTPGAAPTWTTPGTAPTWTTPPGAAPTFTTPAPAAATPPTFDPYAAPLSSPTPAPYSPYAPSPYAPAPYASPYSAPPGALYPEGIQSPQLMPPGSSWQQPLRFLQDARLRWGWLAPMGSNSLGLNQVDTMASFAVPFFKTTSPLVITPGFSIYFWDGPVTEAPAFADLPARTYDAYLDTAWYPQINSWLGAQVGVRIGAYTDFNTFNTQSIRVMGRGLGLVNITPTLQLAAGVVYIDRLLIKLFPAGGLIWTPNPDARYEFLFPIPRLSRRITTIGNTDVWLYGWGEYGGGSWTAQRTGMNDQFDYNDIRFGAGLEGFGYRGLHSYFEVAYVFNREILYRSGTPNYYPSDTVMLRAGLDY
jgi:hypothetical protein